MERYPQAPSHNVERKTPKQVDREEGSDGLPKESLGGDGCETSFSKVMKEGAAIAMDLNALVNPFTKAM